MSQYITFWTRSTAAVGRTAKQPFMMRRFNFSWGANGHERSYPKINMFIAISDELISSSPFFAEFTLTMLQGRVRQLLKEDMKNLILQQDGNPSQ
jgi:hypothetical protein